MVKTASLKVPLRNATYDDVNLVTITMVLTLQTEQQQQAPSHTPVSNEYDC